MAHIVLAIVLGVVGIFILADGFQASPEDFSWFDASCYRGVCIHPKWIAIGAGLFAGALFKRTMTRVRWALTSTGPPFGPLIS